MSSILARFPPHLIAQVQHEVHDLKEDFLSLIYEINKNEKPVWTILKELKDSIPVFIDQYIYKVLSQKYDSNKIKELKKKMPKKSLMNCRQHLNQLISAIEQENLVQEYLKSLVLIINNTNSSGQEFSYLRHSKNWRNSIKMKLLALMLLVYQFSLEKQKNIFNIVDLWYKIYPETPIWQLKDDRYLTKDNNNKNKEDLSIISNQSDAGNSGNSLQHKDYNKGGKSSLKKGCNKEDDLISYELELLEQEFNRNLRISNTDQEQIKKGKRENKQCIHKDMYENDSSSAGANLIYEDEESTTQEEEYEDDSLDNQQIKSASIKDQQSARKKNRRIQTNFAKQSRKYRNEAFSPTRQLSDLTNQFDKIHIETEQVQSQNADLIYQPNINNTDEQINRQINIYHQFSLENSTQSNVQNTLAHIQSSPFLPLSDTTNVVSQIKKHNSFNSNSPLSQQQLNPNLGSNLFGSHAHNLQNENSYQPIQQYLETQQINQQNHLQTQKYQQNTQPSNIPIVPILRNPCHQVFEIPLQGNSNSFNFFISSQ
ncbi:hypothetical protein TTHERM_00030540 (macronuclear) [Tetrahymena thermophila SB210]|uniref:Uncharacterized protein n=1 Tax=Tetrahymena thermophila (strain SB210) TaxID=312017 RepID=Q22MR9_TETTS|nr:hypothetical protein TTHERM_00030540 [Tetrahymena thermophila SB210]EAR86530.1 hypothetical protein TTHERM_00030540 [Tetrahymena thermophila SB210]|eukprot:XP_976951.1 hypothetical protein TTHERM_00030540 [Tetrahymena thermophila SB210]